jgi:uncharacterized membrane protein YfcA
VIKVQSKKIRKILKKMKISYNMRQLFQEEFLYNDIFTCIAVFFISIITTIGGVGGGGLLIPTFLLIDKFTLSESIPLSIITITGDTLVRLFYLYPKKHPLHNKRSIIDLTPLLLIVPFDANTSFFGVILTELFPDIIRILTIIIVLGITLWKTFLKACNTLQSEDKYLRHLENESELTMIVIDGLANYIPTHVIEEFKSVKGTGDTLFNKNVNSLICFSSILILGTFSYFRSEYTICNHNYYYFIGGQFLFIGIYGFGISSYLKKTYENKKNNDYVFLQGDIVWNNKSIVKFIIIGSFTGFLSTYMGIGGGMLITPIMFNVGMIPEVVVATSSVSTFFSTIISLINYSFTGIVLWNHGAFYAFISALGSLVGLFGSNIIISKFKRQSVIIFIVDFILLLSVCLLVVNGVNTIQNEKNKFKSICN